MNDKWIKIYESYEYKDSELNTKVWLNNVLEDNKIPYKNEIEDYWAGTPKMPKYLEKLIFYVPLEFKEQVENYIREYTNSENTITDEPELINSEDATEQEIKITNKHQRTAKLILAIIPVVIMLSLIICGIYLGHIF